MPLWRQSIAGLGSVVARKLRLAANDAPADPTETHGSWANYHGLLRHDPFWSQKARELPTLACLMDTGQFERKGLEGVIEAHLSGRAQHTKFLYGLVSLATWFERHSYSTVVR